MDEILTGLGLDGTGGTDILLKIKIESNSHVFLFIILKKNRRFSIHLVLGLYFY